MSITIATAPDITGLDAVRAQDLDQVGGKAAALGELAALGMPVPPGFVVTVAAYRAHLEGAGALGAAPEGEAARRAILELPVEPELSRAIAEAYEDVVRRGGTPFVAVRSSATAEDLPDASFAGQHDTFLNVRGADEVLDAVRRCWASLWSERAIGYRARMGYPPPALAVVVQAQVPAEVSGVMFTADPVQGGGDEVVVTASYGLGETVVSGEVTPDTFWAAKRDGAPRRRVLGSKEVMLPSGEGSTLSPVPPEWRERFSLDDATLRELAALARRLEAHYGVPQDVEWAVSGGRLYLLQSRPVTVAAPDAPADAPPPPRGPRRVFLRKLAANFGDHFPDPLRPLDFTMVVHPAVAGIRATAGWLGLRALTPEHVLAPAQDGASRFRPGPPRPTLRLVRLPARIAAALRMDPLRQWEGVDLPALREGMDAVLGSDPAGMRDVELARHLGRTRGLLEEGAVRRFRYFVGGLLNGVVLRATVRRAVGKEQTPELLRHLHLALPTRTSRMNRELALLAAEASRDPEVAQAIAATPPASAAEAVAALPGGRSLCDGVERFLEEYGARPARGMVPVPGYPNWREGPSVVYSLLQALLRSPASLDFQGREAEQEAALESARRQVEARLGARGRRAFQGALHRTRSFLLAREETVHQAEVGVAAARRAALELGRRLHAAGILATADDIFYLRLEELEPAAARTLPQAPLRRRIAVRRRQFAAWEAAGPEWVSLLLGLDRARAAPSVGDAPILRGLPASAGTATGVVRIVRSQAEFHTLQPGEILVCPATAPAWTPLFALAGGVVTDIGGPLSHAAIVAREYGIPAVLGTGDATRRLQDGGQVRVDGTRGEVVPLPGE